MKLVKVTHHRGKDPEETSEFVWFEGSKEEVLKRFRRQVEYLLPVFEGLKPIAAKLNEHECFATFAEGLSKFAYWVRVEVRAD